MKKIMKITINVFFLFYILLAITYIILKPIADPLNFDKNELFEGRD
jgi:hypothetical protein